MCLFVCVLSSIGLIFILLSGSVLWRTLRGAKRHAKSCPSSHEVRITRLVVFFIPLAATCRKKKNKKKKRSLARLISLPRCSTF